MHILECIYTVPSWASQLVFSDFSCFDTSLLLLTVTLQGVSNKHCLLPLFHFFWQLKPQSHIHGFGPGRATVNPELASR